MTETELLKEFQTLPNVGPQFAKDLVLLEFIAVEDLKQENPLVLYKRLESLTGTRQDPCVLDTLMAVVDYVKTGKARKWYEFTAERKVKYKGDY